MPALSLDHWNVFCKDLKKTVAFYEKYVGLRDGDRPPFNFPGAWLYAGDRPVVHLVELEAAEAPPTVEPAQLRLSHFAFRATGLSGLLDRLRAAGVRFQTMRLPGADVTQVHFADPDGNALHVDVTGERH